MGRGGFRGLIGEVFGFGGLGWIWGTGLFLRGLNGFVGVWVELGGVLFNLLKVDYNLCLSNTQLQVQVTIKQQVSNL